MRPFNLEKAKEGKPVCTRDGRPVRIICYDQNNTYKLIALVCGEDGHEVAYSYTETGRWRNDQESLIDLFMVEPKRYEGYVNILYGDKAMPFIMGAAIFKSYEDAIDEGKKRDDYATTIKIYFEI